MAEGRSIGTIFAELDLDPSRYMKSQQTLLKEAQNSATILEKNFANLGIKSDATFDLMRARAVKAFEGITASAKSTASDITRAELAKNAELARLNEAQFGKQQTLLSSLKANWLATSAAAVAAWATISKGMEYVELAAKAQQAADSFNLVADSSRIGADALLANLKRAAAGTVDDSDLMQEAVKGMILGLNDKQLVTIMENARLAARYAGTDVKTAFADITNAIGTDMPRALKQYGLITREETTQIQQAMADGAKDISLYDLAMAHAAVNSAKFGEAQRNAAEGVQVYRAAIQQAKESIGTGFLGALDQVRASVLKLNIVGAEFWGKWVLGKAHPEILADIENFKNELGSIAGVSTIEQKKAEDARRMTAKANLDIANESLKKEQERVKAAADVARDWKKNQEDAIKAAKDYLAVQQSIIDLQTRAQSASRGASTGMYLAGMSEDQRARFGPMAEFGGASADVEAIQAASAAKLAALEREQVQVRAILQGSLARNRMSEREYADQVKAMEQELTAAKVKGLQDWQAAATSALSKAVSDYSKYMDQVRALERQIADTKRGTADAIADIKQAGMTPAEAYADKERRANEDLADAMTRSGDEQVAALKRVQDAYKSLGLESARASQEQKAAAQQDAFNLPGDKWRTTPGQHSEAYNLAWNQTTPGGVGSAEWWAGKGTDYWGSSGSAKTEALSMAQKVQSVGDLIVKAQEAQKNAAKDAANQAERMVTAMTDAANQAARLASELSKAKAPSEEAQRSNYTPFDYDMKQALQTAADNIVSEVRGGGEASFDLGGIVPGPRGQAKRATVHAGEAVLTPQDQSDLLSLIRNGSGGSGDLVVNFSLDGRRAMQSLRIPLEDAIRSGQVRVQG